MGRQEFFSLIDEAIIAFKKLDKKKRVRLISHYDCDGISAASILIKAFNNENIDFSISILQQLTNEKVLEYSKEEFDTYFFTDLGSGQLKEINKNMKDKTVFIFDHHSPNLKNPGNHIIHVNPHLVGLSGNREISGAGVVYLFCEKLNKKNESMVHIAVIGAIGDSQEIKGFIGLNKYIYEKAVEQKKIVVTRGLTLFGRETRPLHKILQYSTNPFIPGVTGDETKSFEFLKDLNINPRVGNTWKKLNHLSEDELLRLCEGIIKKRKNEKKPSDIYGNIYTLPKEKPESPTRDAKEFSTVLNACGRMNKASLGIGTCLGDKKIKEKAIRQLKNYKMEILNAMRFFHSNKKSFIKGKRYIIIDGGDSISSSIIGTLCSIIAKSGTYEENTMILALSENGKKYKASLRIVGRSNDLNLKDVIKDISSEIENSIYGGHENASGTIFPKSKKNEFLDRAKEVLEKLGLDEFVEG